MPVFINKCSLLYTQVYISARNKEPSSDYNDKYTQRNFFSLLHRACCFDPFFNIPTHAPTIYKLKSTKFTLKHLKLAPTRFDPFLRPSTGGSLAVLYAVTKLRSVDVRSL